MSISLSKLLMNCKKETTSGRQVVSATNPEVASRAVVDPNVVQDAFGDRHVAIQEAGSDPDGVVREALGGPPVVQEPQAGHLDGVVQEVLEDQEALPGPQAVAVAVPEERDLSLEALVVMATVVFTYIATAMSYPFESLSFKFRFGVWAAVFVGLWLMLIMWWKRNNGDRNLLSRALRQIRGTGGF